MRVAQPASLNPDQRRILQQQARGRSLPARIVERARIVLRAADGLQDKEVAAELGIQPETVARWRNRFLKGGVPALQKDATRPGRPRTINNAKVKKVVELTTRGKPENATQWSTRTMAAAADVSEASVRPHLACAWSEAPSCGPSR
ncbi:MAG TPA: helix-turn-helix domain-containing protein [Bryobacteraceae bacterium]|nr:helix-turn-helix domain-containing protein [Bryobacteraceae bacterium]